MPVSRVGSARYGLCLVLRSQPFQGFLRSPHDTCSESQSSARIQTVPNVQRSIGIVPGTGTQTPHFKSKISNLHCIMLFLKASPINNNVVPSSFKFFELQSLSRLKVTRNQSQIINAT